MVRDLCLYCIHRVFQFVCAVAAEEVVESVFGFVDIFLYTNVDLLMK